MDSDVFAASCAETNPSTNPATTNDAAATRVTVGKISDVVPAAMAVDAASTAVGSSISAPAVNIPDEADRSAET